MKGGGGELAAAGALLGGASYADAVARANDARSAGEAVKGLKRQVDTLCVADLTIGLAAGGTALRALLAKEADETAEEDTPVDVPGLDAAQVRPPEHDPPALARDQCAVDQPRAIHSTPRKPGPVAPVSARCAATTVKPTTAGPRVNTGKVRATAQMG